MGRLITAPALAEARSLRGVRLLGLAGLVAAGGAVGTVRMTVSTAIGGALRDDTDSFGRTSADAGLAACCSDVPADVLDVPQHPQFVFRPTLELSSDMESSSQPEDPSVNNLRQF
jgi:hypothetical protein